MRRLLRFQLRDGEGAGGHRNRLRADRLAAGDVVRRVADDEDALRRKIDAQLFPGAT